MVHASMENLLAALVMSVHGVSVKTRSFLQLVRVEWLQPLDSISGTLCGLSRIHGKTPEAVFGREHPPGFRWLHERFGSNFRLTELQSAIGRIQLQLLPDWTAARTFNALLLAEALADCPSVRVPLPPESMTHAWYKFYAFVKPEALAVGWSRDRILSEIATLGYPALVGSCSEIYQEKCFQAAGFVPAERLPVARVLGETSLMFLVHPTISPQQMAGYADAVRSVVKQACR